MIGLIQSRQCSLGAPYRLNAPLSCPTLAAHLIAAGMETHVLDLDGLGVNENFILDGLDDYDAIGISALSSQAEGARRLIKLIRAHVPEMYVVCGGVDPSLFPQRYLDWGADCVVTGEAEGNVAEVFATRPTGIVPGTPGNIDLRPAWEVTLPKPWQYPGHQHPLALPEAMVMTTRGCPHKCTFCGNIFNGQRTRTRSLDSVAEEFDYLAANGVKGIFLYDDELLDKNLIQFAHRTILLSNRRFLFRAQGRCNFPLTTESVDGLAALADEGLRRVMWGIESFSQPVLDAIHKDITVDDIENTLWASRNAGLENFAFLMAGLPGETPELADVTYRALKVHLENGSIQKVQITPCTPMPGTELYDQAKTEGWLWVGDDYQYAVQGATPWMSQGLLAEHIYRMRELAANYGAL